MRLDSLQYLRQFCQVGLVSLYKKLCSSEPHTIQFTTIYHPITFSWSLNNRTPSLETHMSLSDRAAYLSFSPPTAFYFTLMTHDHTQKYSLPTHVNSYILLSDSKFFPLSHLEHLETASSQTPSLPYDLQIPSICMCQAVNY